MCLNTGTFWDKPNWTTALQYLKNLWADSIVLTEMHLEGILLLALKHQWVEWAYHSNYTSQSSGISVLVLKFVHFLLIDLRLRLNPQSSFIYSMLHYIDNSTIIVFLFPFSI